MNNLFKGVLVLVICVLIASCCPCKSSKSKTASPFLETNWSMVQYEGSSFDSKDGYSLKFHADGKLSGRGDCNRLMGGFTEKEGVLTLSKVAGTRMMCPNPDMERKFLDMLVKVDAYTIDGNLMSLFSDGEQIAIFESGSAL